MPTPRIRSVRGKLPVTLADSVRAFGDEHPECMKPTYQPLYIAALTCALLVDQNPSAALAREFGIANSKLRKEILRTAEAEEMSLRDLLNG